MKLKELQDAMIAAMKAKDKFRKDAISALVSAVKKKGIDNGCRDNIPDEMANEALKRDQIREGADRYLPRRPYRAAGRIQETL